MMLTRKRRREEQASSRAEHHAERLWILERYLHQFHPEDRPHYNLRKALSNGQPAWRHCLYCGANRFTDHEWANAEATILWGDNMMTCSNRCYQLFYWPPDKA